MAASHDLSDPGTRRAILEEALRAENVSAICRRHGISRQTFYNWKARFEAGGLDALQDRPRVPKRPRRRSRNLTERVIAHALQHPGQGVVEMARVLSRQGPVSKTTVHDILVEAGLSDRPGRWLRLEALCREAPEDLTGEQVRFLETMNPAHLDRGLGVEGPGQVVQLGFLTLRTLARRCPFALCVDAWSGFVLGAAMEGSDALDEAIWMPVRLGQRMAVHHPPGMARLLIDFGDMAAAVSEAIVRRFAERGPGSRFRLERCGGPGRERPCGMLRRVQHALKLQARKSPFLSGSEVENWLRAWNERPLQGHPNHGRAPRQKVASIKGP